MVQKARPVADVSNDGWAPTPVYAQVDEATPDDGTFVTAPALPAASFVVRLGPLAQPGAGPGRPDPALTVRLKGPGTVLVELLQGANLVAARTYDTTGAYDAYTMTLTAAEGVAILWPQDGSDPNLRVRITAYASSSSSGSNSGSSSSPPAPIVTACCPDDGLPQTLNLNWKCQGGALDLGDTTVAWNGSCWLGLGTVPTVGFPYEISLACLDGVWKVGVIILDCEDAPFGFSKDFDGLCATGGGDATLVSCCPFQVTTGTSDIYDCEPCGRSNWVLTFTAPGQECPPPSVPAASCPPDGTVPTWGLGTGYPVSIDYATYSVDGGWVRFPIASGMAYKVTVTASGGGAAANYHTYLYEGTSCASKTLKASVDFGDGCAGFTATVTGWMYVNLAANISGTPTYTITASVGTC